MTVAVVTPVYNQLELTKKFVASLERTSDEWDEAYIIDNVSTDNTWEWLDSGLEFWRLSGLNTAQRRGSIYNLWNHGWDWGVQQGYDHILFANNDVEWQPGVIREMHQLLQEDPRTGVVGFGGWFFMVRADLPVRFDERYAWWFGDSDLFKQVEEAGYHVRMFRPKGVKHLVSASSREDNPDPKVQRLLAERERDGEKFREKWGLEDNQV